MNDTIKQHVEGVAEPAIAAMGFELVDVEYVKEGNHWYLRLFIDKEGGVDLDDCANVSREISGIIDLKDPIAQAYFLEISSPGIERPLKKDRDYERFKGSMVKIQTTTPVQGYKSFTGYLVGIVDANIVLEYENKRISIPRDVILKSNLYVEF